MPNNANLRRQRLLGGALGMVVLVAAMSYHFFPRMFHVNPSQQSEEGGAAASSASFIKPQPEHVPAVAEINAGPPLTLAPTAVILARQRQAANLPQQKTADTPAVLALLNRARTAVQTGKLAGGNDSAAALYAKALQQKPDSRAAAQGLFDVRARLVVEIDQDIALGDAGAAKNLLDELRTVPNATVDVGRLDNSLKTLARVGPMLAQAAGLLSHGHADQPAGDNALEVYHEVLKLDPQNAIAVQGLFQVQRAVLDRALAAVAQNDFAQADKVLAYADTIRPGSQQMLDVRKRVDGMRDQSALGVLAQANSALDAGNIDLAEKRLAQARAISPNLDGLADFAQEIVDARLYARLKPGQVFTDAYVDLPGKAPAMVVIPTGHFQMGASADNGDQNDAELPQHSVTIAKGFALARSAITVDQFRAFVQASGYVPDSVKLGGSSVYDERSGVLREDSRATWEDDYSGRKADGDLPVVNISWNDAKAYAGWLSKHTGKAYRLPSEAEFEYALRAGTTSRYWWGNGTPKTIVENLTGSGDHSRRGRRWNHAFRGYRDGYWGPAPVMSFKPNPFGLYDMDGNVSEWVQDCWHDNYVRAPTDGSAWLNPGCPAHVLRGGSWGSSPEQVVSSYRQGIGADVRSGRVGFRVARQL